MDFRLEDIDEAEIERRLSIVEPLTDSVRGLIDAVIRTEVPDAELVAATAEIEQLVARLRTQQRERGFGVAFTKTLIGMPWGNAVVGARNAVAPPLVIEADGGVATAEFVLGAAYEGPGGCVHGGIAALVLDQLVGEAASTDGVPCFTGTLTTRYERPTPLGPLRGRAEVQRVEGRKKYVRAELADADGVTVVADAIMVSPKGFTVDG